MFHPKGDTRVTINRAFHKLFPRNHKWNLLENELCKAKYCDSCLIWVDYQWVSKERDWRIDEYGANWMIEQDKRLGR